MKQLFLLFAVVMFTNVYAQQKEYFSKNGIALNGYDVVAYFTESKPVKGEKTFSVNWKESTWFFSSSKHAALFKADPEKYAPQYGGYCAYGCSRGYKVKSQPEAWRIVNGKLYLNYDLSVREIWEKDIANYIQKADAIWPSIIEK